MPPVDPSHVASPGGFGDATWGQGAFALRCLELPGAVRPRDSLVGRALGFGDGLIQHLDGLLLRVGRQVRVPEGHLDRRVSEKFLDHLQRHALHRQVARVGVPQVVPPNLPSLPADRVEGHFGYIEGNFLAGRDFRDWRHLNQEARTWCEEKSAVFSRSLHASRRELFAVEKPRLKPLPIWVPEVYVLHHRVVDSTGYVNVATNRYSVPYQLIGRQLEVRETKERVEIFDGPRVVATHERVLDGFHVRVTAPAHRPPRGEGRPKQGPPVEEEALLKNEPSLAPYVAALKKHASGRGTLALRRLLKLLRDYPRTSLLAAVRQAEQYGLYDLDRLERMVLKEIARAVFQRACHERVGRSGRSALRGGWTVASPPTSSRRRSASTPTRSRTGSGFSRRRCVRTPEPSRRCPPGRASSRSLLRRRTGRHPNAGRQTRSSSFC